MWGWENSRNLFETETPSRVCVTVTNSTNTPRAYCVKKHVYRPCSSTKCMCKMSLKPIEKLLDKVCFYQQHYKFLSINSFINFFLEGTKKFRITVRADPSPNYVGERSDFFISISKKALNTRLFWGTGEDGTGKSLIHQNSCYQETSSTTNWKPCAAQLNLVGHRMKSLPGHEHLAEELDWKRNETKKLFVKELLIKKESFAIL